MELHYFLHEFLIKNPIERAMEFGAGHSTKVLSEKCKRVISIDSNPFSIVIPVTEQRSFDLSKLSGLRKPSNVTFICEEYYRVNMKDTTFSEFDPQLIVFDIGMDLESKHLYRVCYERLKSNINISKDCVIIADNSDMQPVKDFAKFLEQYEGYKIEDHIVQFIARKG